MISRWAGHRTVLCPVVFLGGVNDAERVAEGCSEGVMATGWGVGKWHLSRRILASRCVSSCMNFPIRARHSRFVREFPDSCALFPLEQGGGLPSGAICSTHWGESLHPAASTGANRSSAGALLPDSCANFPIRARFGVRHGMCIHFLA